MKKGYIFFTFLLTVFFTFSVNTVFSQCVLSSSDDTQQEALDCLTSCGCSEIEIPNGVTVTLSEDWDLSSKGVISFTIKTGGKLELPGQGASNRTLIMASGSYLIVEDGGDTEAITGGNGNGQVKITIGDSDYRNGDLDEIITAGGVSEDGLLPVELLYFKAMAEKDQIVLSWATASELNNNYFILEKSEDGKQFELTTEVKGNGTTSEEINYQFIDMNPHLGLSYYRLSQTDYDGTTEVFPIISILFNPGKSIFTISPNPIENQSVKLRSTRNRENEPVELNILDLNGKLIDNMYLHADQFGNIETDIQLRNQLKKGTYIFELTSESRKVNSMILVE